ncbi:GlxA family transcriptional regulator [Dactylosporangium darangshiense]|uniref:GlxA family transcriptional regulator n=1 Tax=Dactylosporangium darangshiense TaxID=579108 RepID=UPI0031EA8599
MRSHSVLMVLYDGVRLLDVTGPLEVFAVANEYGGRYRLRTASPSGADVRATAGLRLGADAALADVAGPLGTLVVPGAPDWAASIADRALLEQVRRLAGAARRTASVCAGAFPLAAAGLLDGRRAATHWSLTGELARAFPGVDVDPDAIFVRDGRVFTSAGITAGIDLSLSLVEHDLGAETARLVAKHLVVFMARPGGQSQFSVRLGAGRPRHEPLRRLLDAIAEDPAGDHTLAAMAGRAGVSARHLTRLFRDELDTTPAAYVARARVEAARTMLEGGTDPLDVVARRAGLGSAETLRRAFAAALGVTPAAYRARFASTRGG